MYLSESELRSHYESIFPNLQGSQYIIKSPLDAGYNCIAWAADDDNLWWWPTDHYTPGVYWPAKAPRDASLDSFVAMYSICCEYEECNNPDYELEFEKIALYSRDGKTVTHAAKQVNEKYWWSKLGKGNDIWHTLDALSGPNEAYGKVGKIMRRRRRSVG